MGASQYPSHYISHIALSSVRDHDYMQHWVVLMFLDIFFPKAGFELLRAASRAKVIKDVTCNTSHTWSSKY